jgi:prepilin-type N-terminal cleavage/methylation domain-containing protein
MDKKKGFTLVELLAVIVILAIIALIATPIILNVISDAKKEAAKDSAYGYIEAIENAIIMNDFEEDDNFLSPNASGCYGLKELDNKVNIKGTKPKIDDNARVCLKDGTVTNLTGVEIDGYEFTYANDELSMNEKSKKYTVYANGTEIYYNPETGKKCTTAVSTPGTKSGCMKWYAFNDDDKSSTVNVILDHNTTANEAWNSTGSNSEMKEVAEALKTDTSNWKRDLNPRLIEANEIAKITGNTGFDVNNLNQDWFCLDTNKSDTTNWCAKEKGKSEYAWLFDYTYDCTNYGCNKSDSSTWGYWTSTTKTGTTDAAWGVNRDGTLSSFGVVTSTYLGIRPVITISKSNI